MLPEPDWEPVGETSAWMQVHKNNGRLFWNAKVHQYLGLPETVCMKYDSELNKVAIVFGFDFAVVEDEDGNFYIDAKEALEECGLVFPLAEHITAEPEPPTNSHNLVMFDLESE